jgi:hypothetical protein
MEECPELLTASGKQYNDTYSFFKNKTRKLPIDNYLNMLFYDTLNSQPKNLIQYELLTAKVRRMAHILQKQFTIISNKPQEKN